MIDHIGDMDIQTLIELTQAPPEKEMPRLFDVGTDKLKDALHKATELDNKLRISSIRRKFGPKWHYKPVNAASVEPDDESAVKGGDLAFHLGLNAKSDLQNLDEDDHSLALTMGSSRGNRKSPRKVEKSPKSSGRSNSPSFSPSKLKEAPRLQLNNGEAGALKPMDDGETAESYVDYVIGQTQGQIPKHAQQRFPSDAFREFGILNTSKQTHLPRASTPSLHLLSAAAANMQAAAGAASAKQAERPGTQSNEGTVGDDPTHVHNLLYNLLVFNETEICLPQERSNLLANERFAFLHKFIDNRFIKIFQQMIRRGFDVWRANMTHLRFVQHNVTARKIQKEVRRWLCRVCSLLS
jgi:hypothetical protein